MSDWPELPDLGDFDLDDIDNYPMDSWQQTPTEMTLGHSSGESPPLVSLAYDTISSLDAVAPMTIQPDTFIDESVDHNDQSELDMSTWSSSPIVPQYMPETCVSEHVDGHHSGSERVTHRSDIVALNTLASSGARTMPIHTVKPYQLQHQHGMTSMSDMVSAAERPDELSVRSQWISGSNLPPFTSSACTEPVLGGEHRRSASKPHQGLSKKQKDLGYRPLKPKTANQQPQQNTLRDSLNSNSTIDFDQVTRAVLEIVPAPATTGNTVSSKASMQQKFPVSLPKPRSADKVIKPIKRRLERSKARACFLCRVLKAPCSEDTPCGRCVEKFLGRRDLAFTHCLRDHPSKFNIFAYDEKHESNYTPEPFPFLVDMRVLYGQSQSAVPFDSIYRWTFHRIHLLLNGTTIWVEQTYKPGVILELRLMLSKLSYQIFQYLEDLLRSNRGEIRQRRLLQAQMLAAWMHAYVISGDARHLPTCSLETKTTCRRYLQNYIQILDSYVATEYRLLDSFSKGEASEPSQLQGYKYLLLVIRMGYGPRTRLQICHQAVLSLKYILKANPETIPESCALTDWDNTYWTKLPYDWSIAPPQTNDYVQPFAIWFMFFTAIPARIRKSMDYCTDDFLPFVTKYEADSQDVAPNSPLESWQEADVAVHSFREALLGLINGASGGVFIHGKNRMTLRTLELSFAWPSHIDCLDDIFVSPDVQSWFRWAVPAAMGMAIEGHFGRRLINSLHPGWDPMPERFKVGRPLFEEMLESMKVNAERRRASAIGNDS